MLVSIILPIYNVESYLEQCVQSLLDQTYRKIEILLVDDGSTDSSGRLCDMLASKDARIKVFHKENGGTHTARNLGIEKSRGEYLMFIDPDDWIDTCTVYDLVLLSQQDDLDIVRYNYVREFESSSVPKKNLLLSEKVLEGDECRKVCRQTLGLIGKELSVPENMNLLSSACFSLYRKSIISEHNIRFINIREVATFSDGYFNISFLMHANKFQFVDKCYYHYRKFNSGAATSKYRENFLERQLILFDKLRLLIDGLENPEFEEAIKNRISLSTLELCLNVFKGSKKNTSKYKEIQGILKNHTIRNACCSLKLKHFPVKWKVYYGLVKYRVTPMVFAMTYVIRLIQRRG